MCNGKGHVAKEDSDSYYHSMGVAPCPHKKELNNENKIK